MKEVTAYRCDFHPVGKVLVTKQAMKRHEKVCIYNPANKTCATCEHDYSDRGDDVTPGCSGCAEDKRGRDVHLVRDCMAWELRTPF